MSFIFKFFLNGRTYFSDNLAEIFPVNKPVTSFLDCELSEHRTIVESIIPQSFIAALALISFLFLYMPSVSQCLVTTEGPQKTV